MKLIISSSDAVLIITYLAYNRGFVNKNVTAEMLPADWSE